MPEATSLVPNHLKFLFHGDTGVGKTRLAATAALVPEMCPVLYFDFEAGLSSVVSIPGLDMEQITFWSCINQDDLLKLENACKDPKGVFRTVVADSLTEMYGLMMEIHLAGSGRANSPPQIQDYGLITSRMMRFLRSLQRHLAVHFIATAGTALDKDEISGKIEYQPDILGKLNYRAPRFFDTVGYLSVTAVKRGSTLTVTRTLQTQPFSRIRAKDRFTKLPPLLKDPTIPMMYQLIHSQTPPPSP